MSRVVISILGLCFVLAARGQSESGYFHSSATQALPNVTLPSHVVAPDGAVTLFADHANATMGSTPLYLVNRSREKVTFASQDGDLGFKLEFQTQSGLWQRAQGHVSSWCGNSYGQRVLQPGQHFMFQGYRPASGKNAQIRYANDDVPALASNHAEGYYLLEDAEAARLDDLSLRTVPSTLIGAIPSQRGPAFRNSSRTLAAMHLAQALGDVPRFKKEGEKILEALSSASSLAEDEVQLRDGLKALINKQWAEKRDHTALLKRCLQALTTPDDTIHSYGEPELLQPFVWEVIVDVAELQTRRAPLVERSSAAVWKQVFDLAIQRIAVAPQNERNSLQELLGFGSLVDEFVEDAALEGLLAQLPALASNTLSSRGLWERLVELGWKFPPDRQIAILHSLARGQTPDEMRGMDGFGGYREPASNSAEELFWKHCIRTQPVKAAHALSFASYDGMGGVEKRQIVYAPFLKDMIHLYWMNEMNRADGQNEDFALAENGYACIAAVKVLGATRGGEFVNDAVRSESKDEEVLLLRRLLTHRGYQVVSNVSRKNEAGMMVHYQKRQYVIRQAAKETLFHLKELVPDDVVLEWEAELPQSPVIETRPSEIKPPAIPRRRNLIPVPPEQSPDKP